MRIKNIVSVVIMQNYKDLISTRVGKIVVAVSLSWVYAVCSQIIIPMPFNLVPVSIQPMPIFLCGLIFGWPAVSAYALYLAQGALGAPIFAGMQGGMVRIFGPTGGYLCGFFAVAVIAVSLRNVIGSRGWRIAAVYVISNVVFFLWGLVQLSWFVPADKVIAAGLFPFVIGDFVIKPLLVIGGLKMVASLRKRLFTER